MADHELQEAEDGFDDLDPKNGQAVTPDLTSELS